MHTKVLAILYFLTGYFCAYNLIFATQYFVQSLGGFVLIYLTYQLIEQLEQ